MTQQASPSHDSYEELEELRARCSRLESQVAALVDLNSVTTEQLHKQTEALSSVVALLTRLGFADFVAGSVVSPEAPTPVMTACDTLPALNIHLTCEEIDAQFNAELLNTQIPTTQARQLAPSPRPELYHRDDYHRRFYLEEPTPGQDVVYTFDDACLQP